MSSIKVTNCVFKRSGDTIQGQVTFATTFNEVEVKLNVGFIPTLYVIPSYDCTSKVLTDPGNPQLGKKPIALSSARSEVAVSLSTVVQPSGNTTVVTTVPMSVSVNSLFAGADGRFFTMADASLDVRVEISPDLGTSSGSIADQRFSA